MALNQVIVFEFSEEVVASSVTPETMRIRLSPANAKQVPGDYNISGNIVEFFPRLPVAPDLSDAGRASGPQRLSLSLCSRVKKLNLARKHLFARQDVEVDRRLAETRRRARAAAKGIGFASLAAIDSALEQQAP